MKRFSLIILGVFLFAGIQAQDALTGDWSGECNCNGKDQMVLLAMHDNGAFSIVIGTSDPTPHPGTWSLKRNNLTISTPEGDIKLKKGPIEGDNPVWKFHTGNNSLVFEQVTPVKDLPEWARGLSGISVHKN